MQNFETERERAAGDLAERLFFELEKQGNRYSLCRKIGSHARRGNLTLDEVGHVLALEARGATWRLTSGPIAVRATRSRLQPRA
jgi:hypothetical protein